MQITDIHSRTTYSDQCTFRTFKIRPNVPSDGITKLPKYIVQKCVYDHCLLLTFSKVITSSSYSISLFCASFWAKNVWLPLRWYLYIIIRYNQVSTVAQWNWLCYAWSIIQKNTHLLSLLYLINWQHFNPIRIFLRSPPALNPSEDNTHKHKAYGFRSVYQHKGQWSDSGRANTDLSTLYCLPIFFVSSSL